MTKRYSLPSEEKVEELILALAYEENELPFNKVSRTSTTHGIVCLGFQHKYEYDEETGESTLVKEAIVYDVDIMWKDTPVEEWNEFEVNPKTPNHKFFLNETNI